MFSDPSHNVEQFDLQSGMTVADFGTGSGHYAFAAARAVGDKGKVYAIDVQKTLLEKLKRDAVTLRIHNVEIIWADIEKHGATKLRDGSVDAAIIANLLFQVEKKDDFLTEVNRVLKPKGRVLVIDWHDSFGGMGPNHEHIISVSKAKSLFEAAGFVHERDIRAGEHHWGIILRKS
jgi:ubiquinone/menaquinone biosynthesis C-methylase UbiE